ncbi:hypothetical protein BCR43DRAFT_498651 [Syncephalastrum racemosum]|uniref:Uncharacterized protein n=1 Tax=Syncephalastrum racemosum TaxID=13706 RepID=A0A1X2H1F5_SYNRA|nr:hypothetical protein BCR43DRAFT_498651 [Syncephalastrum racemosum]
MVFTLKFPKNLFRSNSDKKADEAASTPATSGASSPSATTPPTSRTPSLFRETLSVSSAPATPTSKYLSDPMRSSKRPDYVGGYYDPMSARSSYCASVDVTNTGA